ncbi:MAG: CBS domain-containing protein [Acetobacteraceae bacterium]|nr:CBS domain-containing protein [Acetobacteraceae bacterium]MBV8521494.1 CBS domain-containing protein [Acetobacteraceae bacterium]MBV8591521.1 CBS domain-containing protein [Acetobacteraceae bacterium]
MLISDVLAHKGPEVIRASSDETVRSAVNKLSEHRIGALVVEDRWLKPIGIFSERDLLNCIAHQGPEVLDRPVHEVMTRPMISFHPQDRIDAALAMMTMKRIRHLPITEGGKLVGIVSIGDLVKHRLDEKELENSVLLDISRMRP